jgi:hypothetical protein
VAGRIYSRGGTAGLAALAGCPYADASRKGVRLRELFDPAARQIYEAILAATAKFGAVTADEKKTSVHLVAKTGFAGVHPRKSAVVLNIRSDAPIKSQRIRKLEQVSTRRFHNELLIDTPAGVDLEVIGWLKRAYDLNLGIQQAPA